MKNTNNEKLQKKILETEKQSQKINKKPQTAENTKTEKSQYFFYQLQNQFKKWLKPQNLKPKPPTMDFWQYMLTR